MLFEIEEHLGKRFRDRDEFRKVRRQVLSREIREK